MPRWRKMSESMLRPAPYMQSMANLKLALATLSTSANLQIAATYAGLKSASSMFAGVPLGMAPLRTAASISRMMAGVADPPYFALYFTPFQFHDLMMEVLIATPAATSHCLAS